MKLKKIRNALLVVLTLALVSAAAVAVTWALNAPVMNTIINDLSTPEMKVLLSEYKWDGVDSLIDPDSANHTDYTADTDAAKANQGKTKANPYTLDTFEGKNQLIPKNPSLSNTSTAEPEFVAMTAYYEVDYKKTGDNTRTTAYLTQDQFTHSFASLYKDAAATTAGINTTDWEHDKKTLSDQDNTSRNIDVYYFKGTVDSGEKGVLPKKKMTPTLFEAVDVNRLSPQSGNTGKYEIFNPNSATSTDKITIDDLPSFRIILRGYAVQAANMDGADANARYDNAKTELDTLIAADVKATKFIPATFPD